jgi:hypothetical protein
VRRKNITARTNYLNTAAQVNRGYLKEKHKYNHASQTQKLTQPDQAGSNLSLRSNARRQIQIDLVWDNLSNPVEPSHVWRDQLETQARQFAACVRFGESLRYSF